MQIALNNGLVAQISDEDLPKVAGHKWYAFWNGARWYVQGYVKKQGPPYGKVYLHRWLLDAKKGEIVDHVSGDGLDNRRENLRKGGHAMNNQNRRSAGQSGFKGVDSIPSVPEKWRARIRIEGRQQVLGWFNSPQLAAKAYDQKARELYGPQAKVNFV